MGVVAMAIDFSFQGFKCCGRIAGFELVDSPEDGGDEHQLVHYLLDSLWKFGGGNDGKMWDSHVSLHVRFAG
jgi:hypothetical protein